MSPRLRLPLALVVTLSALGSVSAAPQEVIPAPAGTNLLRPLSDTQKWQLQTLGNAKADLTRDANALTVTTTAVDGTDYHVQLCYPGPPLQAGKSYTLRFRAKADPPRKMPVYGIVNGGDFHGIGLWTSADLSPEFQIFAYTFVAKDLGDVPLLCPQFLLGGAAGSVTLSDVSLTTTADGAVWFLVNTDPGKATLTTDGDAKTVTITQAGTADWHVQLNRALVSLKEGRPYVIRFRAKADPPRDMAVSAQINGGDYHSIAGYLSVPLGTDWKPYTLTLTPHDTAGHGVYFPQFLLGKQAGTVWLDGVTAEPATPDPVADPVAYAPKAGEIRAEGAVQAGGFGRDSFTLLVSRLVRPDGTVTPLSPARPKLVRLTAGTEFRSLTDGSQLYLATLKPGDTVSIVGPDLGVGKPLPARLMLR